MDHIMLGSASFKPILALLAGILVLVVPRLLNYIVAGFFLLFGLLGLPQSTRGLGPLLESAVPVVAGIIILIYPRFLSTVVGSALILLGVLGLLH